mmetsp:Transcript_17947/g.40146  ORF Transcript_17947/g.40146 Transcript_17947/m.40146 type:complete len:303 (+) Transcript_17947:1443-2351(+)
MPSHPVEVFPLGQRGPWLDGLAVVLLDEAAEFVDAEGVNEVLQTGGGADLAVTVVALHRQDSLHGLKEVLLLDESQVIRRARERRLLAVGASHAAANDDVETFQGLPIGLHDNHTADVVDVEVDAVVARDSECDLELLGKVGTAVQRLNRVARDDAVAVVVRAHLVQVELINITPVILDGGSLLAIEPELIERLGHGLEEVSDGSGVLHAVFIGWVVVEGYRRRHDVAIDVAATTVRVGTNISNGSDHVLQVAFDHAVQLESLAGRRAQVTLSMRVGEIVQLAEESRRDLTHRHLEPQHELV